MVPKNGHPPCYPLIKLIFLANNTTAPPAMMVIQDSTQYLLPGIYRNVREGAKGAILWQGGSTWPWWKQGAQSDHMYVVSDQKES